MKKNIKGKSAPPNRAKKRNFEAERKEDYIYFENGIVFESLPGASFRVKVNREKKVENSNSTNDKEIPPIIIVCHLKTKLIKKRVLIIKGDKVIVEVNPMDMYFDEENNILKGIIVQRL